MKKIYSFVAFAALCLGFAACQVVEPEDVFSTDPVAPELQAHNDILLTTGTTGEDVMFTWTAYRNLSPGLDYQFFMERGEKAVSLSTGKDLYFKADKGSFRDLVLSSFSDLPENDTFPLSFYVRVTDNGESYVSNTVTVNVYAFGDAVASVVTLASDQIELDPGDPTGSVELLSWTPARLVYGESVSYNVYVVVGDNEPYLLAEGLAETSYSTTVDALNEAIIAAGGDEAADVPVRFVVEAVCESLPGGVEANSEQMTVKTYVASFPNVLYVPGSHQEWNPATAPTIALSSSVKGYYEGIVDLTTADGSDVEFKFSPYPEWKDDFGGSVTVGGKEGVYVSANGTVGASDNIKVPSGKYVIKLNKKLNTINMVSIKSVGVIGTAVGGWDAEIPMEWNEETNVFTVSVSLVPGEYKFRLNDDWDWSVDDSNGVNGGGGNYSTSNEGDYKIQLDMSKHPYTVKFINLSFPETLGVTGSHQGWDPATAPRLNGDGEGHYEGFINMANPDGDAVEFKFTPNLDWSKEYAGSLDNLMTSGGGNISLANGYYKLVVDLSSLSATATRIESVEICGSFTGWGVDPAYFLAYDAANDAWKIENVEFPAGGQWKFRMNDDSDWAVNLGYGTLDNLVQGGDNITDTEPGIYTVELYLATTPYRTVLTKTGESDAPKWGNRLVVAGNYSGHSWDGAGDPKLRGDFSGKFQGPLTMAGSGIEFKFVHNGAWFGMTGGETLDWTVGDGGNFSIPAGTYWFNVDLEAGTATAFAITKVGLIGSFNDWSGDVEMSFDETALTYSGTITVGDNAEFKVRFNGNWDYSLGDDPTDLNGIGAGNVKIEKAGTYKVVLDMAHNSPSLTVTAQ
ncbi:MAG: SusE domain-containing protein [Bacteroidales bacterium]|nr:SusE domain-containing protein [Bacteroidales bacterium]